ncbi:MAG: hypothetical protein JST63_04590 [Bacteroidetes bacterium]|nr:hypothetical protein [Bacteroidota bacterium]
MNHISYIEHEQIDVQKWDNCIEEAGNSLIYGYSWWLDSMSPGWHGLVLNDYEAVMPLTWRKKYGICYLYQPFCTAALGVFFKKHINPCIEDFFKAIPTVYKYWDIDINEKNEIVNGVQYFKRTNQLIDLRDGYKEICKNYSRLAGRMINKARGLHIDIVRDEPAGIIVSLFQKEYRRKIKVSDYEYIILAKCCEMAKDKGMLKSYIAKSATGIILAFYIVLYDDHFGYSLLGGSTPEGKDMGAFYLLTDAAIHDQCNNNKIFRFEGSDQEGIAFFNRQFGAVPVSYLHIKHNRLPSLLKFLK